MHGFWIPAISALLIQAYARKYSFVLLNIPGMTVVIFVLLLYLFPVSYAGDLQCCKYQFSFAGANDQDDATAAKTPWKIVVL